MNDAIINMINNPAQRWIVVTILSIVLAPVEFLIIRFVWSLPTATRRTLLKIVLVVLFFPLIFLFLMCMTDSDD